MAQQPSERTPLLVGGQAVLEGVMMRGPDTVATAVRRPDGTIAVHAERFIPLSRRSRLLGLPVLRGAAGVVEMLTLGIRMLNFSAEVAMESEGRQEARARGMNIGLGLTVAFSLLAGAALFMVTPVAVATVFFAVDQQPLAFNLVAGAIRMTIFLTYLAGITLMPDIRRVFEYHGAEHKTVAAHEAGGALTPASAATFSRFHPRCGTSFLLVVMLASIALFALGDTAVLVFTGSITFPIRIVVHLAMIPLVGGLSYEALRFTARHAGSLAGRWMVAPGLWLQRITTREPDEAQIEIAIVALRRALGGEGEQVRTGTEAA
jgi:uncharacterized protein YqhQ